MTDKDKTTEADLCRGLSSWLNENRWEVFKEVQLSSYGRRADIVARRAGFLWVIEAKQTLTLAVMEQARWWRGWAHHVSIATWQAQRGGDEGRQFARQVCEWQGIGLLLVSKPFAGKWEFGPNVNEAVHPKLWREGGKVARPHRHLEERLCEEHKTFAEAGNNKSRYWSPFQQTCRLLSEVVAREPGIAMKDAIAKIKHHYASDQSARGSICKWLEHGSAALDGIQARREGKLIRLYPKERAPDARADKLAQMELDDAD